jgi:hypothetical protein
MTISTKIYLPIMRGPYSAKDAGDWTREVTSNDMVRATLVKDIKDGQYDDDICQIVEIDLAAGTSKDVTIQIAEEIRDQCDTEDRCPEHLENWFHALKMLPL